MVFNCGWEIILTLTSACDGKSCWSKQDYHARQLGSWDVPFCEGKSASDNRSIGRQPQYNLCPSRSPQFREHCWIWDYAADVLLKFFCCPSVIVNYACVVTGSWINKRERVVCSYESRLAVSWYARRTIAPTMYSMSYTGLCRRYYALGNAFVTASGIPGCGRTNWPRKMQTFWNPVALLYEVCLPNWKWSLPTGQSSMSKGSKWF